MGHYQIRAAQNLSCTPAEAWEFLSNPGNLQRITPPKMKFEILDGLAENMFAGQIIHYKVSPFKGFKTHWVTEITHVKEGEYFVDEQRFGPYAFWHHQHRIEAISGGTRMEDIVNYKLPLGPLGDLAHGLFVKRQLKEIFAYREAELLRRFGKAESGTDQLSFKKL
ncbi:Ligand-binding SRPBCC domain-containing protein [Robiginitalea myxolifaciens]|uniref:Ligand-binding SRPBCC domain-containing protein n=1 Tax=Robiginitalea myxolifaciens TaxID=400055 RepID=A0A1I6H130_9FLAO|nr:SRPBCC family protein [Robiginitalea myxolifaciens]SFR48150.1 Ligand-binding SRPBCC domain-containing protein [Robiginitalea myxolifaciens]